MRDPKVRPGTAACLECGSTIAPNWPHGLCSRCALEGALDLSSAEASEPRRELHDPVTPPKGSDQPSPPDFRPRRFGGYELLGEIARGGMGVVYRARQLRLNRIVALKMILSGQFADKQEVLRFRGEAEAAANLQHPNIVAIYETGEFEGQHYFSMEFVQGRDLAQLVRDGPVPAQRAARYTQLIAEAIHYAHQQGILHRDLKPSNILVDEQDRPRITDFGLAKRARGDFGLTLTGQTLGSPSFMPPEQAGGKSAKVGPPSDVYGIGAILYHLLTGRPPFQAETVEDVLLQLREAEPVSPRLLNPSVPRDLETLCLKCLEKDPALRYPSAQDLADELGRFLLHEPIHARPLGLPGKLWRWCLRKPVLAMLILLIHLVGALGLGGILWQWRRAELSAEGERRQRAHAEAQAYASDMDLAAQALEMNNLGRALALLNRHRPGTHSSTDLRGWEWRHLWSRSRSDELATLGSHAHSVSAVAFSPAGDLLVSAGFDGKIKLWNLKDSALAHEFDLGAPVRAMALSSDGRWLAALCTQGQCRVWELPQRREVAKLPVPAGDFGGAVVFAPGGNSLAVSAGHGDIQLWDLPSRALIGTLSAHQLEVKQLAFSADGRRLYSAADDRAVRIWDVPSQRELASLLGHERWVSSVALAPDESILVSGSADGTARVWDLTNRREIARLTNHASLVWDVKFSPDGSLLATCGADQRIRLWNRTTWRQITSLQGHLNEVWTVAFSPDGNTVASSGKDESVRLWKPASPLAAPREYRLPEEAEFGSFAPGGLEFCLVQSNTVTVWDTLELRQKGAVTLPGPLPTAGQLGIGGDELHVGFASGDLRTIDIASGQDRKLLHAHQAEVIRLNLSHDGRYLASAGLDEQVLVHDARTGERIATLRSPSGRVQALSFSPDGAQLAGSVSPRDEIVVFDVAAQARRWLLSGHKGLILGLSFSPDGRLLASASWDATVRLWDLGSGRLQASLPGHLLGINGVAFTSDGQRLAGGTGDGLIKLWDVQSRQEVLNLRGTGSMGAVWFVGSGETLVSASMSSVQLWPAPSLTQIERIETESARRLKATGMHYRQGP